MKKAFILTLFLLSIFIVKAQQQSEKLAFPEASQFTKSKLTFKIIDVSNQTFGYDIYADEKLIIHQPTIPAVSGNDGFKTKSDAEKVAQLVISKIEKGEMPPTISQEEMKKMKVIE